MSTFATIATELLTGVLNTHPNTTALVKAAMVRQLLVLQAEKAPFMEKSGSFNTQIGIPTYDTSSTGMPKGLLSFERLWYDQGTYTRPLEVVDMMTIRTLQEHPNAEYPFRVAWWEGKLQFGPAPAGVYAVKWDIILDATKDTATGALLTTSSTTQTNAWFLAPQATVFKHLVWADYFSTSPDQRPDLASSHQELATVALARMREANAKRQQMSGTLVQPSSWDNYGALRPDTSVRVATLFPGAPV